MAFPLKNTHIKNKAVIPGQGTANVEPQTGEHVQKEAQP